MGMGAHVLFEAGKVGLAVQHGVSPVCATCSLYWRAREQGVPGARCLATTHCASPLGGDAFSSYQGPLGGKFETWCFVCAEEADVGLRVGGLCRVVGVCKRHLEWFRAPTRAVVQTGTDEVRSPAMLRTDPSCIEVLDPRAGTMSLVAYWARPRPLRLFDLLRGA